ncbi:MAG TPA: hypothetical protein VGG19_10205 [Tepidisphaeraceae bacterium]|jgi:hypothetical protein
MQEMPLFPKAIRLILYAVLGIGGLAITPAVISHLRTATASGEENSLLDQMNPAAPTKELKPKGTIVIQAAGKDTAAHRRAELEALQAKLQANAK